MKCTVQSCFSVITEFDVRFFVTPPLSILALLLHKYTSFDNLYTQIIVPVNSSPVFLQK